MANKTLSIVKRQLKKIPLLRRGWNGIKARLAYRIVLGRKIDCGALEQWQRILKREPGGFIPMVGNLAASPEFRNLLAQHPPVDSLPWHYQHVLHQARRQLVASLPQAAAIVDLGGSCPQDRRGSLLYMGYPHAFRSLTIVDLPPGQSVEQRGASCITEAVETPQGPVRYEYRHMSEVAELGIAPESLDLLWMGQSLEHISEQDFDAILAWAKTALAPQGILAWAKTALAPPRHPGLRHTQPQSHAAAVARPLHP